MHPESKLVAFLIVALFAALVLVISSRARAAGISETVTVNCPARPCTAWTVNLAANPAAPVNIVLTAHDADQSNEGTLYINEHPVALFGPLANSLNDGEAVTLPPIETDPLWWTQGANSVRVAWSRPEPQYHEILSFVVSYTNPEPECSNRRVFFDPPTADTWRGTFIVGCQWTDTKVWVIQAYWCDTSCLLNVRAFLVKVVTNEAAGPLDLSLPPRTVNTCLIRKLTAGGSNRDEVIAAACGGT